MDHAVFIFTCLCFFSSHVGAQFDLGCVEPPMECPNENVTFWLYTRANKDDPHQLLALEPDTLESAPWVKDAPIKILIHGYTGYKDYSPNTEIRPVSSHVGAQFDLGCVEPPMECPNENVTFWLYTRANKDDPHQLLALEPDTLESAPWVKDAPIKILIHGYTGYKDYSPNTEIRPAYMECCDYNIISVDYNPIARKPCYFEAARNTELVGMCTAQLIDELVSRHGFALPRFHVIGFSLGGETAGYIANYLKSGKLERITALDPAMPLFVTPDKRRKIDSGDAKMVDALHTNALQKGKLESCGIVDFYANGGLTQPGCMPIENQDQSGCDHARAPVYYAESILTSVGFYGYKCPSWINYIMGWCDTYSSEELLFGEYMPLNSSGLFFFETNSEPPYARGRRKQKTSPMK